MLISDKKDNVLTLNSTVSDNQKEDSPTDYCSSFYSNDYHVLIQSQQFNPLVKEDKINKS